MGSKSKPIANTLNVASTNRLNKWLRMEKQKKRTQPVHDYDAEQIIKFGVYNMFYSFSSLCHGSRYIVVYGMTVDSCRCVWDMLDRCTRACGAVLALDVTVCCWMFQMCHNILKQTDKYYSRCLIRHLRFWLMSIIPKNLMNVFCCVRFTANNALIVEKLAYVFSL